MKCLTIITLHEMETATINDPQELSRWLLSLLPASVTGSNPEISIDADELLVILNLNTDSLIAETHFSSGGSYEHP